MGADLEAGIDRYIADQPEPPPNRSEAIRLILRDWLIGHGYLENPPDREDAH